MFQFPGEPVADRDQIFECQRLSLFYKQPKYQFLDKKSAEHRHLSLGKDPFIVHRPAKIRVQPVHHQLFFLHLPFRESLLKRKQQLPVRGFLRTGMIQIGKRLSEKSRPAWGEHFQFRYDCLPDLLHQIRPVHIQKTAIGDLLQKSRREAGALMPSTDRLPGKQFLFCHCQLKVMCTDQQLCHPILHRNTSILKHSEQIISRIHQRAEKKIVKIIVGLLSRLFFKSPESHRICLREDDPRRLRTGE